MTHVLERPLTPAYSPPALETLGTLRTLTRGAGPGGEPVVMQTPPFAPAADAYVRPALIVLGTLRGLTRGAGPDGELIVMQTLGDIGIPGGFNNEARS